MSARSEYVAQMNSDVQSGINSANQIVSGIAQARDAYHNTFYAKIESNTQALLDNYKSAIDMCNDPDQMQAIESEYTQKMNSYLTEINAPKAVRKKWNEETFPELKQSMDRYVFDSQVPMMWNTAVAAWEDAQSGIITQTGSDSNLDYSQKKAKLTAKYEELNLANAPKSIVGDVTTVDQALQAMQQVCVTQYVDRYYAKVGGKTDNEFNMADLIKEAVDDVQKQVGITFDPSTRAAYEQSAKNQIEAHEQKAQDYETQKQQSISDWVFQGMSDGNKPSESDILIKAVESGAIGPDGKISKYWTNWGLNNLVSALNAENDKKAVSDFLKVDAEEVQTISDSYDPTAKVPSIDAPKKETDTLAGRDFKADAEAFKSGNKIEDRTLAPQTTTTANVQEETKPTSVFDSIFTEDGIDYQNGYGEKTYTFSDGSSIPTSWAPRVESAARALNIELDSKEAMELLVKYIEDEGLSGAYEDPASVALIEEITRWYNDPDMTITEYHNKLQPYLNSKKISQDDLEALGLWSTAAESFDKFAGKAAVEADVALAIEDLLYSGELKEVKSTKRSKYDSLSPSEKRKYKTFSTNVMEQVKLMYGRNPEAFNKIGSNEYNNAIDTAIKTVNSKMLTDQISAATKTLTTGFFKSIGNGVGGLFSSELLLTGNQRSETQQVAAMLFDSQNENYPVITNLLNSDVQVQIQEMADRGFVSKEDYETSIIKGKKTGTSNISKARENLSKEIYKKEYKKLGPEEKANIEIGLFINQYSVDLKNTIMKVYELDNDNLQQFYIDGIGPAYYDNKGNFYTTDGSPTSTNFFIKGILSPTNKNTLKTYGVIALSDLSFETEYKFASNGGLSGQIQTDKTLSKNN